MGYYPWGVWVGGVMFCDRLCNVCPCSPPVYGSGLGARAACASSCGDRCPGSTSRMKCRACCERYSETVTHMMVAYAVPLFLLTLYYNYGYEYGVTGLHLVYPLTAVLPYLLNGQRSRELLDACQVTSAVSAGLLLRHGNFYALGAHLAHSCVYYFNRVRGIRYRVANSPFAYNVAMFACCYLMYVALLQSCVDSHGRYSCYAYC